jgi:uncharacterized membrane protein YsdA (DUF1294 family)/cold shock CspA family protein
MRFEGVLTSWNDERGFGYIESTQGGEPIFVHASAWPRSSGRPTLNQVVTFRIETGPKGKRAREVQIQLPRRPTTRKIRGDRGQWGTASLFAIPAFLVVFGAVAVLWRVPIWAPALYIAMSVATYLAYAEDKSAADRGAWRTPESTLHALSLAGGWPGALIAQQLRRHKTTKRAFRQVFWGTVVVNVVGFLALAVLLLARR